MISRNGLATETLNGYFDSADDITAAVNTDSITAAAKAAAEQAKSAISNQVEAAKTKIEQAAQTATSKVENTVKSAPSNSPNAPVFDDAYKSTTATITGVIVGSITSVLVYKNLTKKGLLVPALAGVAAQGISHVIAAETIKHSR